MPKKPMRKWHSFSLLRNKPLLHRIATELAIRSAASTAFFQTQARPYGILLPARTRLL